MGANLCNISTSTKDLTFCLAAANPSSARVVEKKDPSSWTKTSAASESASLGWYDVTYGNAKFVAIAFTGTPAIMYSSDGINWTSASATEANGWYAVTYGNGKFVAVATNGTNRVMYASDSDLSTWTAASAAEANSWRGVTYGNGKFVAVASSGTNRVMYASDSDLSTWTAASAAEANQWYGVTYGGGKFVAVTSSGTNRVMYSSDGINWTSASAAEANSWISVTYGNGKFVAVSYNGTNRVMYASDSDLSTWTAASAAEANSWYDVTYGNGYFVAVSHDGTNRFMYSSDAITWTAASAPTSNATYNITYGNDKFVAVSYSGTNRVMYSSIYEYFLNDLSKTNAPGVLFFDQNLTSFQSPYVELNMNGIKDYYKVSGGSLTEDAKLMVALTFFGLNPYTIEFWVNRYDGSLILDAGDYTGNWLTDPRIAIAFAGGKLLYRNYGSIEWLFNNVSNNVTVTDEVWSGWMHYVITREGTGSNQCKLYHNGSLLSQGTDSSNHTNSDLPKVPVLFNTYTWAVSGTVPNSSYPFKGKFGLFKIYNGNALSATEVLQNYNATKRRFV